MYGGKTLGLLFTALLALAAPVQAIERGKPVHGLTIHGMPKYGPTDVVGFVNVNAPKGGTLTLGNANDRTFDTFNSFITKGTPARNIAVLHNALMISGVDEPGTNYCLVCETVEVAPDNSWIEFKLRPGAHFSDGSPITADDVVFSFETLRDKGAPFYRMYWADVEKVEARDTHTIRFTSKNTQNTELPVILGQITVLSKAWWGTRNFEESTLDVPVGSGPYTVDSFEVGRYVAYKRVANYWAKDLPMLRGYYNFDAIRVEYFRDDNVRFEAFKSGAFDVANDRNARQWVTAYDFPAVKEGRVKKIEIKNGLPAPFQGFNFNLRRKHFQDRRVRQAMNLAFDFESLNATIFYDQYVRLRSYWQRSELEAKGLPDEAELKLLEPLRGQIPDEVFTQEFTQPVTTGQGNVRDNLLKARELLTAAGYKSQGGQLISPDGTPFTFEIMVVQASLDRVILPWLQNLERLGIKGTLRVVDSTQYFNRATTYDYDISILPFGNSISPGNELAEYLGSEAADREGGQNFVGVKDPAIDSLVQTIINAQDRAALVTATRALDRVLSWNFFYILHYGSLGDRYAYWDKLRFPDRFPLNGLPAPGDPMVIATWWMDPAATAR